MSSVAGRKDDLRLSLLRLLDNFMHFEGTRSGKNLGPRSMAVRLLKFFALGPPSKRCLIFPVGQYDVVVALDWPQDL